MITVPFETWKDYYLEDNDLYGIEIEHIKCETCYGDGFTDHYQKTLGKWVSETCSICDGEGEITLPFEECNHEQKEEYLKEIYYSFMAKDLIRLIGNNCIEKIDFNIIENVSYNNESNTLNVYGESYNIK